jgi:thioredoxin-related protein
MLLRVWLCLVLGFAFAAPAAADQLVMFEQAGCPYCAAWNHDVGGLYAKTDEAQLLPLRRVDIHAARPADLRAVKGIHFTPTFVVIHCGREAARLTGYTGDANFWGLLDREITTIKGEAPCPV